MITAFAPWCSNSFLVKIPVLHNDADQFIAHDSYSMSVSCLFYQCSQYEWGNKESSTETYFQLARRSRNTHMHIPKMNTCQQRRFDYRCAGRPASKFCHTVNAGMFMINLCISQLCCRSVFIRYCKSGYVTEWLCCLRNIFICMNLFEDFCGLFPLRSHCCCAKNWVPLNNFNIDFKQNKRL